VGDQRRIKRAIETEVILKAAIQPSEWFVNVQAGLAALTLPPRAITKRIKHLTLPTFTAPIEQLELTASFPGAACVISFGESVIDPALFYAEVEFRRAGQPTLFLRDYLANRHDPRLDVLRFKTTDIPLAQGIAAITAALASLLDHELLPMMEGRVWLTAPFDWGDLK
jgi:hypothetical protein